MQYVRKSYHQQGYSNFSQHGTIPAPHPQITHPMQLGVQKKHESRAAKQVGGNYMPSIVNEAYHNVLEQVVIMLAYTTGFDEIEESALESLLLLYHSMMKRISEQSRLACEVAGRTMVTPGDVWFGLINMGHDVESLPRYLNETFERGSISFPAPEIIRSETKFQTLHIGTPRPLPQFAYEWMPQLPDPHTYIKTEVTNEPDLSYEKVREAMAQKKRNGVTSLVNHMVRTYPTVCLFPSFRNVINQQVQNMIEKEGSERRREEAFIQFRDILSTNDIDNVKNIPQILFDNKLITKEELDSGVELACMCSDGTILDTNGEMVEIDENTAIDLKENQSNEKTKVDCLEPGAESTRFNWNMDEMLDELIEIDSVAFDAAVACGVTNKSRSKTNELTILQDKVGFEYIPEWCHVLEPSNEHHSYLLAVANDVKTEEDLKKEEKSENPESEITEEDNQPSSLYFQQPRVIDTMDL